MTGESFINFLELLVYAAVAIPQGQKSTSLKGFIR